MITTAFKRIRSLRARWKRPTAAASRSPSAAAPVFTSAPERIRATGEFTLEDVDLVTQTRMQHGMVHGSPWDAFRTANMLLPEWFDTGLDPYSDEHANQQFRLWALLAQRDRPYAPEIDEKEAPHGDVDPVRRPSCYMLRDNDSVALAGDHIIATGMILKHSGVKPGCRVLEYGAGWGQTALALARLGVLVDTVDISRTFCGFITDQADFFQVPLKSFEGRFGWNPRGDQKYDLIFFYEAFHHCAEFRTVVHDIKRHLAPGGRVLLVGEPISRTQNRYLPYSWGLRLDADPIAHVRHFGWLELGFTEDFLVELFTDAGFTAERVDCEPSIYGTGYIFKPRGSKLHLAEQWMTDDIAAGWNNPEEHGRWTKAQARLLLDTSDSFQTLEIDAQNHHPFAQSVEFRYGTSATTARFSTGERKTISIDASRKAREMTIRTRSYVPARDYFFKSGDTRALGILIRSLTYKE